MACIVLHPERFVTVAVLLSLHPSSLGSKSRDTRGYLIFLFICWGSPPRLSFVCTLSLKIKLRRGWGVV